MDRNDALAREFDEERPRLRAVAYRMLGSTAEAEDAVQEAWIRLGRTDRATIDNLPGWLTTVVARVCLDMLRARREDPLVAHVPDPVVTPAPPPPDPETEALLTESVGLALLVVLETLAPAERLAFVLHDMFGMPFEEIGPMVDRTPAAARQLASRARRRVQGTPTVPDTDLAGQRKVVDAFFAASRNGDMDALVAVLDPDVVLHADGGAKPGVIHGAEAVAAQAMTFAQLSPHVRPAVVNGTAGVVVAPGGRAVSVMAFTVRGGRIVAIEALADPERLARLDLSLHTDS